MNFGRSVRIVAVAAATLLAEPGRGSDPVAPPWQLTPPPHPEDPAPRTLCGTYVHADPAAEARLAASTDLGGFPAPELPVGSAGLRLGGRPSVPRVHTGDNAHLRLALVNETKQIVGVVTGAYLHARVTDRRGRVIWQHPPAEIDGMKVGLASIGCWRLLLPGQPLELAVIWDLTDLHGRPVPPGDYVVALSMGRREPSAAPFRIAVAKGSAHRPPRKSRE